jgi:methylenetetrahydrofolate dehydrogenase (NADP+)/methenyltetrahydrofolate cyclohydrolase
MVKILRGDVVAAELAEQVRAEVAALGARGVVPGLAVVLVGHDPASQLYVKRKIMMCAETGIRSIEHRLPDTISEDALLDLVGRLNGDPEVHGILVQLPLPPHIASEQVLDAIAPGKDVDGFHPVNVGRLSTGTGGLTPCTPLGCMVLLDRIIDDFRGLKAVVIGKSNIVGKPVALLLMERECTVTVCHKETRNLPAIVATADIVVAAAGSPRLVRGGWIKDGAVIIDVGINRITDGNGRDRVVGDVAADEMAHAAVLTPVPGGVGPMTIACLLANTVKAASQQQRASAVRAAAG